MEQSVESSREKRRRRDSGKRKLGKVWTKVGRGGAGPHGAGRAGTNLPSGSLGSPRPLPGKQGLAIKGRALDPARSRPQPAMHSNTLVTPDPEAQRSPASPGRVCNPLPWALSAALLLLAAACATCVVRVWGVPGTPASPVSSPAPSSILPVGLEQTSDPHARLPNSPQVRYCPIWTPRETCTQPRDPFSICVPASRGVFSASQAEGGETHPPSFLDF